MFTDDGASTSEFNEDRNTTPLIACITNGNPMGDLNYLLERGANVNVETINGETALSVAAEKGNVECVELLLQHDAFINVVNKDGETPLMLACRSEYGSPFPTIYSINMNHNMNKKLS
nr:ankyrin repeat protein [Hymenolepis microstoma]